MSAALCSHCLLPIQRGGYTREIDAEPRRFCCYGCALAFQVRRGQGEEAEATWLLVRLGVGGFLVMNIMLLSLLLYSGTLGPGDANVARIVHWGLWLLTTPVLVILGGPFLHGAWRATMSGRITSDTLIAIGALSAYGYSAFAVLAGRGGVYFDTVTMVLMLFTLGRYLEAIGRARAMRRLAPMLAAERATATVVADGQDVVRPVRDLELGTRVRVRPGERISVDGRVVAGRSQCDESVLTGESRPQPKSPGVPVYAGSVNGQGQLIVALEAAGATTRWGQLGALAREALAQPGSLQRLTDSVAAVFVPLVLMAALGVALHWIGQVPFDQALMYGLAVLVVACPCALGLAAPLATSLGIARAAEHGILIRSGAALERLARIRTVAFDKTGTLTDREFRLANIVTAHGVTQEELLKIAAGIADGSEHPLAHSIVHAARGKGIPFVRVADVQALAGEGLVGRHEQSQVVLGSLRLMAERGLSVPPELSTTVAVEQSVVYIGWDGRVYGSLHLSATVLPEAKAVVKALHDGGLSTALISGDSIFAAKQSARELGVAHWRGRLSPDEKVAALAEMSHRGPVAVVGDGLNDGPVLARADVGIAVGDAADLARAAADVVLPIGGLGQLPRLIGLARSIRKTTLTNLLWAFGYNLAAIGAAAAGLLQPVFAAALMAGSSLFVVMNSLAVSRKNGQEPRADRESPLPRTARLSER
jgi:Cu2+-exporting ATPase